MSYETVDGDTIVEEFTAANRWVVVGPEQLADELGPRGLTIIEADADQFLHTEAPAPCSAPAGSPRRGHGAG